MAVAAGHTYSQTVLQGNATAQLGDQYITQVVESEESTRQRVLGEARAKLAPVNFDRLRREKRPTPETCGWVQETEKYKAWRSAEASPVLWIQGKPGCGKTVIASTLIKSLEEDEIVLFYFCVGTDGLVRTSESVVRTLLCQILDHPKLQDIQTEALKYLSPVINAPSMSLDALCHCLARTCKLMPACIIVLDGLDEIVVDGENRDFLLDSILSLTTVPSPQHKALFLSRPEEDLRRVLETTSSLPIHTTDNEADVGRFIEAELARLPWLSRIEETRDRVAEKLTTGANGMFLWVRLMLDTLKRAATAAEVEEFLNNLPKGLDSMYTNIIRQLSAQSTEKESRCRELILTWVSTAIRPLSVGELIDALAMDIQSRCSRGDWMLLEPEAQILRMCGSLVQVTDQVVQLTHFSVKEYLCRAEQQATRDSEVTNRDAPVSQFYIDVPQANALLASVCLAYFLREDLCGNSALLSTKSVVGQKKTEDFERNIMDFPLLKYASNHWADHLLLSRGITAELLKLIADFQCPRPCLVWYVTYPESDSKFSTLLLRIRTWSAQQERPSAQAAFLALDKNIVGALEFGWLFYNKAFGAANERGLKLANDLSGYHTWRDRYRDAELICKRVMQDCVDAGVASSEEHLNATLTLAQCISFQQRYAEAIDLLEPITKTNLELRGITAIQRYHLYSLLGRAYADDDDDADALSKALACINIARTTADGCPAVLKHDIPDSEGDLGSICTQLGRLEEAQSHLDAAYEGFLDLYGVESYHTMYALRELAHLQKAQQQLPVAIETMEEVLRWGMENEAPDDIVYKQCTLGLWCYELGDEPRALRYLQSALDRIRAEDYPDHPFAVSQMTRTQEVIEWIEESMAMQKQSQETTIDDGQTHEEAVRRNLSRKQESTLSKTSKRKESDKPSGVCTTVIHTDDATASKTTSKDRLKGFGKRILSIGQSRQTREMAPLS